MFNFPSVAAFLAGTANAFNITLGERRSVDRPARHGAVRPGPASPSATRLTLELGTALRVARHADRAGRPVRRLRRGERVAGARRRRRRRDLPAEQPELRAARSASPGISRPTAARCCAPPMAGRWTNRARRRSGTRPAIRRSRAPLTAAGSIPLGQRDRRDAARRARAGDGRSRASGTRRCSRGT